MAHQVQVQEKVTVERGASEASNRFQGQLERREFLKYVTVVLTSMGLRELLSPSQLVLKAKGQPAPPQVPGLSVRIRPAVNPHDLIRASIASAEVDRVMRALAAQGFSTEILESEAFEFEVDHLEKQIKGAAAGSLVIFKLRAEAAILVHLVFRRIYVSKPGITPMSGAVAIGAIKKAEEEVIAFEDRPDQDGLRITHWNTPLARRLMNILSTAPAYQAIKERLLKDGLRPAEEFHTLRINPNKQERALIVVPVMEGQTMVTSGLAAVAARVDLTSNTVLEVWEEWR